MRQQLTDLIICPECRGIDFEFENKEEVGNDIREGQIICQACKACYTIKNGIIFLHDKLSNTANEEIKAIQEEIDGLKEEMAFRNDDWLLNFPDNNKIGVDIRTDKMIRIISDNALSALKEFIPSKGVKILEIGAANCWLTSRLAECNYCVALDIFISYPQGLEAGDIFIKNKDIYFERVCADMLKLPFRQEIFDIVVISSSLHHSSDLPRTLEEIGRVLKQDGRLILLGEPSHGLIGSKERLRVNEDCDHGINELRYSINEWKNAFIKAGFEVKIYLPLNFTDVLRSRGKVFSIFGGLLDMLPSKVKKIVLYSVTALLLAIFDGFYNAVLSRQK
jgi:SAM-dependent methyltransferase/uncharacterized protein YbaR (Trm112 family)